MFTTLYLKSNNQFKMVCAVILAETTADLNFGMIWDLSGFWDHVGAGSIAACPVCVQCVLIMCEVDLYDLKCVRVQIKPVTPLHM